MAIVTQEPISHRTLRRHGLEGRVIRGRRHGCLKPIVADTPCPHPLVTMGVVDEPFYRVIGICRFIDSLTHHAVRVQGTNLYELTLTMMATADILEHQDIVMHEVLFHATIEVLHAPIKPIPIRRA